MRITNFTAKLHSATTELYEKCIERGYKLNKAEFAERAEVNILDEQTIKIRYLGSDFLAYTVLEVLYDNIESLTTDIVKIPLR